MLASTRSTNILLIVLLAVGIAIVAMLATGARGGPLDPSAAPGSTGIPINEAGSWSQSLSGVGGCNSPRFKCVLPTAAQPTGEGILDRETGLVWQRTASSDVYSWFGATYHCESLTDGLRRGWRLPAQAELDSVADPTPGGNGLPLGMPYFPGGVPSREYWSSTQSATDNPGFYWWVDYDGPSGRSLTTTLLGHGSWCVRSPETSAPW